MSRALEIRDSDIRRAEFIRLTEQIKPVDNLTLFGGAVLCVLMGAEKYERARILHRRLMDEGFSTPEMMLGGQEGLRGRLHLARWPNRRLERLVGLSSWWLDSDIPGQLIEDANNGQEKGVILRDQIAAGSKNGLGCKSASLLLTWCGYQEVAPLDVHMCRFLASMNLPVKVPDYIKVGALPKKKYLEAEEWFKRIAQSFGFPPAQLHRILWGKAVAEGERFL
jgi:thermostable 8-oxoguanine DNA glycosylase